MHRRAFSVPLWGLFELSSALSGQGEGRGQGKLERKVDVAGGEGAKVVHCPHMLLQEGVGSRLSGAVRAHSSLHATPLLTSV